MYIIVHTPTDTTMDFYVHIFMYITVHTFPGSVPAWLEVMALRRRLGSVRFGAQLG
jgi:hypothetical protein